MSSEQSREEMFREEASRRKKEKEEQLNRKNNKFNQDYEEIVYTSLEYEKQHIVRILGNVRSNRKGDPFSAKAIYYSKIINDNNKQFKCYWPSKEENSTWILWKIFDKVMAYKWDKTLNGGKGGRIYLNSETHKDIFFMVDKNGIQRKEENGWKPVKQVAMNIIDRHDMNWHKKNKHTKLITKNSTFDKEREIWWSEPGIPESLYFSIWDDVVEKRGDWHNYDIALLKQKTGPQPSDVRYKAIYTGDPIEIQEEFRKFIVDGPLTEEELSWERYNIDKLFRVSTYQKIKKNLSGKIKLIDASFGTKFFEELEELVEKEKKEFEEIYGKTEESPKSEEKPKEQEKIVRQAKVDQTKSENSFNVDSLDKDIYKGIERLSPGLKSLIIGKKEDGSLIYNEEKAGHICSCNNCGFESPLDFPLCPKCGSEFTNNPNF